jgi:hypothetical protein
MPTFAELYTPLLKEVIAQKAREQLEQGADALAYAHEYAEKGKPEFVLAYLLQIEATDEVKRGIYAYAYERRAKLSEEKAQSFSRQFHRSFPLIKTGAQKDRLAANQVRQGQEIGL